MTVFNRGTVGVGADSVEVVQDDIRHANGLHRATLPDAFRFGGEAVRAALSTLPLTNDRRFVSVDAKVQEGNHG